MSNLFQRGLRHWFKEEELSVGNFVTILHEKVRTFKSLFN